MIQDTFNQLLNQIVKQELRIKLDVSVEIGANMSVAEIEKEVMTQVSAMFPSNNKRIQSLAYAEECAIYSTEDGEIKWSFLETDCIGRIEVAPRYEERVEYEIQISPSSRFTPSGHRFYCVDVRKDTILPCGEIESEYVYSKWLDSREEAEAESAQLGKLYKHLHGESVLIDPHSWIDNTDETQNTDKA